MKLCKGPREEKLVEKYTSSRKVVVDRGWFVEAAGITRVVILMCQLRNLNELICAIRIHTEAQWNRASL